MTKEKYLITPPQDGAEQGEATQNPAAILDRSDHFISSGFKTVKYKDALQAMHEYAQSQTAALRERVLALEDQQINMAILLHERADLLERREQRIRELTEHIELISLR